MADSFTQAARPAQAGLQRPLLYLFQFVTLPEEAFQNHPELIRELVNEPVEDMPLLHARSIARIRCEQMGLPQLTLENSSSDIVAEYKLFSTVTVQAHKSNGYTAHVVTMPEPQFPPEAYFAAIVFKDDEPKEYMQPSPSTRYFTLEKSKGELPVLGECLRDGKRRNYGAGPAPDKAAFLQAVLERVNAVQPDSGRVLLEGGCAALMRFAPRTTKDYHLVHVEFEDGTQLPDAKVYRMNELELPPAFMGKKVKQLAINSLKQP